MSIFGLTRVKEEGAPCHPDDIAYGCGCDKCHKNIRRQAQAHFNMRRLRGDNEEDLKKESNYQPPEGN